MSSSLQDMQKFALRVHLKLLQWYIAVGKPQALYIHFAIP